MEEEREIIHVWVTKYALTKGIIEAEAIITSDDSVSIMDFNSELSMPWFYKGSWHRTKEDAVKRAEEMRKKKIESLKKQIEKLEKLKFD